MTRVLTRLPLVCGLVLALAPASGCQSFNGSALSLIRSKPKVPWSDNENVAVRCLCLWQPAEGTWKDRPTRGFGGQIFFLGSKSSKPVAVTGDVLIHVFDDLGSSGEQAKPIHTFSFKDSTWNNFLVQTQFGPAYNIFIPYTRSGQVAAECSLRVRLSSKETATVFSEMAYVQLPGVKSEDRDSKTDRDNVLDEAATAATNATASKAQAAEEDAKARRASVSVLPPELEAHLAVLLARRKIAEKTDPARFVPPSTASPIVDQPSEGTPSNHVLTPAHPLSGSHSQAEHVEPSSLRTGASRPAVDKAAVSPLRPVHPLEAAESTR